MTRARPIFYDKSKAYTVPFYRHVILNRLVLITSKYIVIYKGMPDELFLLELILF